MVDGRIYVWGEKDDELDAEQAKAKVDAWLAEGGDPATSPFEPTTDIAWFVRELTQDLPELEVRSDAMRSTSSRPVWLSTDDPPPARVVVIDLDPETVRDDIATILSIAAKYDLSVFEPARPRLIRPLEIMSEYATSTFWPRGAIQAFVAGAAGLAIAWLGWYLGIIVVSWIAILAGGFMFVMAVATFVFEGWRLLKRRSPQAGPPTPG
jgi:hypothetical protein